MTASIQLASSPSRVDMPIAPPAPSHCSSCGLHSLCLPTGLDESDMLRLDKIIGRRRRIPRDSHLYRMEEGFSRLYAIRVGHFKTYQVNSSGEQQITGFQMPGAPEAPLLIHSEAGALPKGAVWKNRPARRINRRIIVYFYSELRA